jgi:hypothetical protein
MSAEFPKKTAVFCPECGKRNPLTASQCWFCLGPLPDGPEITFLESNVPAPPPPPRYLFGGTVLAMVIALAAVVWGVGQQAPGAAVMLAVIVGPALLVTLGARAAGRAQGRPLRPDETAATFAATAGAAAVTAIVTVAIIAILPTLAFLALIAALLILCARVGAS